MIQEASSMTTTQSFIGIAFSSNIKCSFCLCEECEKQHDYFISRVNELNDIFKEMTYNIDEEEEEEEEKEKDKENEKEKEQEKEKEKEKVKKKAKEKEKKKEKKVKVVNCDVKQQYPFEGAFPKKKDWFYVLSQPNKCWTDEKSKQQSHSKYRYTTTNYFFKTYIDNASAVPEYENKIVGTIKGFSIHVIVLKEKCIKTEPTGQFLNLTEERTNLTHSMSDIDCGLFVAAYAEFLSDRLQVPSDGISFETLRMRYALLLYNYEILKARSDYVNSNIMPHVKRKKREKEKNEVDDDGERAEEVEEEEGKNKEVIEEEEGKNKEALRKKNKKKNEVEDDKGKNKEADEEEEVKNKVEDDEIKIVNAHTFPVHLQPNATGDSIMRSTIGKTFDSFRIMLKQKGLEDFFRKHCFGHFLDLPEKNNAHFQMTMVYELLKRRFIFQNLEKKDEVLINYCGMSLFFGRREFAIVSVKCHPPSEPILEFIVKKQP
ncbi:hypothetical protein H5410_037323 [Solanum commersonii]|uniref:Ubiquitin-like protease family profile domain-containing protein n=1 Tax=Solanum commersonii TaxID=4109 RepID=A0A9J5Y5Y0_SOLCO|nr:hypothetical protein H5410_037323 [Solanum commersonii]